MSRERIEVRGLTKTYEGGDPHRPTLDRIDLDVPRGHFVSLIGPSGCGKSTLIRVVAGLEDYDEGSVRIFDSTPRQMCAAKAVGFVPQSPALLPWLNVRRNITLPARVNRRSGKGSENPDALLRMVGLDDAARKYPHELSGGMRQRVAIARAFGTRPDLLLMDEPFSALDEFTREALQWHLLGLWERMSTTVLFVTHSVREAVTLSDEIVVMSARPGRVHEVIPVDLRRPRGDEVTGPRGRALEDRVRASLRGAWESGAAPDDLIPL